MLITPQPPAENGQGGFKHGSILDGNFLRAWVNSQWKSTPRALPLVGKGGAGVMQPGQEVVENQHLDLESETQAQGNQNFQPQARHLELLIFERSGYRFA